MQGFVTSYDYSSGVVRFGVNVNAPEGTTMVTDSPKPDPDDGHKTRVGLIIAIVLLLIIVLIVIIWFLLDKRRSKNQETEKLAYEEVDRQSQVRNS